MDYLKYINPGIESINTYEPGKSIEEVMEKYLNSTNVEIPPLVKFPEIAKKIIENKEAQNHIPPKWVKEKFLDNRPVNEWWMNLWISIWQSSNYRL